MATIAELLGKFGSENSGGNKPTAQKSQHNKHYQPPKPQKNKQHAVPLLTDAADEATAPYNFVTLPHKIIPAPLEETIPGEKYCKEGARADAVRPLFQEYILANRDKQDSYSGFLDVKITTETPCFIGGNGENKEAFFAPSGQPLIPGSTLRGMTKNIFKIITCGTMRKEEDFHNQRLYFRSMAAVKSIPGYGEYYKKRLNIKVDMARKTSITGAKPGFLVKEGKSYYICPAKIAEPRPNGFKGNDKPMIEWGARSCTCYTGPMNNKKHYDVFSPLDWAKKLEIPEDVITAYREDKRRGNANGDEAKSKPWSLFTMGQVGEAARNFTDGRYDLVTPCYYMVKNNQVQDFGFGPFYRIPYMKAIGDPTHIPEEMQADTVDFSDAVFGRKEFWASRVFFEDAVLQPEEHPFLQTGKSHPLMSPNPTSFQLYLEPNKAGQAQYWDLPAGIRGYKLYWHQACGENDWRLNAAKDADISGTEAITPVKAGSVFIGRIRFKELTAIELGAFLKVFDLAKKDRDLRYKLGKGKSLGMGSIKLETGLHLGTAEHAYQKLFNESGWADKAPLADEARYQAFLKAFDDYIHKVCAEKQMTAAYEILQGDLRHLLNWKNGAVQPQWKNTVRMMRIDDKDKPFQHRTVLPTVKEIFKGKGYKS